MEIKRPATSPQTYEGIPGCYIGTLDLSGFFPNVIREQPIVTVVYESHQPAGSNVSISLDAHTVRRAIDEACDQYRRNIAPERIEDRFQSYLTEERGLSVDKALRILRRDGISPFITLELMFVSEPNSAICFDFACFGEEYLNEYGFSFDLLAGGIEFVTPRILMKEGSFPACRINKEAEQAGADDAEEAV